MATYTEQGEIDYNSGDVGGDIQASDSVSRRFSTVNADGTFTTVDVHAWVSNEYLSDDREPSDRFWDFVVQTFITTHTDPEDVGGSEIGADVQYDRGVSLNGFETFDKAFEAAKHYVETLQADRDFS